MTREKINSETLLGMIEQLNFYYIQYSRIKFKMMAINFSVFFLFATLIQIHGFICTSKLGRVGVASSLKASSAPMHTENNLSLLDSVLSFLNEQVLLVFKPLTTYMDSSKGAINIFAYFIQIIIIVFLILLFFYF